MPAERGNAFFRFHFEAEVHDRIEQESQPAWATREVVIIFDPRRAVRLRLVTDRCREGIEERRPIDHAYCRDFRRSERNVLGRERDTAERALTFANALHT